ncbi:hypothetical protein GWK47_004328 [Chionoecetes opilio]|uniref:Uncharacterized protein n=1 Tax=Chionoecetes opilio TaxID=41210 RepID=A0A8J4YNM6_CHIOP|nr:hypothetical protein GWK47_004328 [Chionoecetes opilio]
MAPGTFPDRRKTPSSQILFTQEKSRSSWLVDGILPHQYFRDHGTKERTDGPRQLSPAHPSDDGICKPRRHPSNNFQDVVAACQPHQGVLPNARFNPEPLLEPSPFCPCRVECPFPRVALQLLPDQLQTVFCNSLSCPVCRHRKNPEVPPYPPRAPRRGPLSSKTFRPLRVKIAVPKEDPKGALA